MNDWRSIRLGVWMKLMLTVFFCSLSPCAYGNTLGPTGIRTGAVESGGRALAWNYDGIYRLSSETISADPNKNNGAASYTLDPVGNRLSVSSSLSAVGPASYSFNADDEVASETYEGGWPCSPTA